MSSEDLSNIRKFTNTRTQVRNLIKEFNLSRQLSVPTESLDYYRQQVDLDGMIEVTDDQGSWAGSKPLKRGYYLTFEPDFEKLNLWHKLDAPFSLSIDSSFFQRNGQMFGIPLPIRGYDNGLVGSVQLATGFDGIDDYVDIPHTPECSFDKVKEGFTFHIKFAPCDIKLSNGQPVTLYAKKDPPSPRGFENSVISILHPDGHVSSKLLFNGVEYTASANDFFNPTETEFGITKWYDHTLRFSRIQRKLELLINNVQYNDTWVNPHLTPYPFHDIDWHIGRSTYTNRGLFWGGLGDFRYYWDLFFTNQHSFNLYTNRITISKIPYGQSAVVGHSYITHSLDLGMIGGFLPPLANGKGFRKTGGHFLFKQEPFSNDLIPVYDINTYPKSENDFNIVYNIDYSPAWSNDLGIKYAIDTGVSDGTITNDVLIQYDIGTTTQPPPPQQQVITGWTYDFSFGRPEWDTIEGIGVDSQDNIYVVDAGLNDPEAAAVYKFTKDGVFIMKFGSLGSGQGQLDTPYDIKVDPRNGHLWVADQFNNRIQEFDANGNHLSYIGPTISGLTNPSTLYIPEVIAIDPVDYSMYISDTDNNRMIKLDANRNFVRKWGSAGSGDGQFNIPHGMCLSPVNRHIYVTNHQDARIQEFDGNGTFIRKWGTEGNNPDAGQFIVPKEHISVNKLGWLFQTNGDDIPYIVVFDATGNYKTKFGSATPGSGAGQLREPESSISNSQYKVYVTSQENHRVEVFKPVWTTVGGTPEDVVCPIGFNYNNTTGKCYWPDTSGGGTNPPPVQPVFNIGLVSDWDNSSTMQANCNAMKAKGVTQVVITGDFGHGSDSNSSITALNSMGSTIAGCNALYAIGNHADPSEDGSQSHWDQEVSYFCLQELGDGIAVKSKQVHNVYFIMLSSQDPNFDSTSSPQYTWCQAELQKAAALKAQNKVHWIIVGLHKPLYCLPTDHPVNEAGGRAIYQPLFTQYQVDFVYSGHNHVLEYSKPLGNNGAVSGTQLTNGVWDFTKTHGQFYSVIGTGGRTQDSHSGSLPSTWQYANDSTYGFTLFTIDASGLNATIQFWNQSGSNMLYEYKVTKSGGTGGGGTTIPPSVPFKFNLAGDFRGGQPARDTADNLVSDTPDVMFFLGDYGVDEATPTEFCNDVMAVVKNSNIPVWGCLGNHDSSSGYLATGFFENTSSWVWSVKYGNIRFISCDTIAESVSATQTLVQAAQSDPAINIIVILMHESVFKQEGGGTVGSDTTIEYHNMFKLYPKVKLVIAGHSHNYTRFTPWQGIQYIINEDGGQQPDADTGCMHCSADAVGNITCKMITNLGVTLDTFTIPASSGGGGGGGGTTNPPPQNPQCPTGYHWVGEPTMRCLKNEVTPPPPSGDGTGVVDPVTGIEWKKARGAIGQVIPQSRNDGATDDRWSEVFSDLRKGFEVTAYGTFGSVGSGGHWALKHWGGNHSGDCQYEEDGSCCCWYDTGIRSNGAVQFQTERPHPSNSSGNNYYNIPFLISNIGVSMSNHTIGLKWVVHPVTPNGDVTNGGVHLMMWVDTDGLLNGRPQNHWRLVYDYTDMGDVLGDYPAPTEQEIECRNSDTSSQSFYMGGIHWRRMFA